MEKVMLDDRENARLQRELEGRSAENILRWSIERFWPKTFMTSGFGSNSICVVHMLKKIKYDLPILFIDTGFHFPETLRLKDYYIKQGLNIKVLKADITEEKHREYKNNKLYETDPDLCCKLHKMDVFKKALKPGHCWIAPVRKSSAKTRREIKVIEKYENNIIKICPLANWTYEDVWNYIRKHNLKYNELYDQGYLSIGCQPCTAPVKGLLNDERAGRWPGKRKTECGLHTFLIKNRQKGDRSDEN